jgi:quercetin dioxygenase-like cupin family protein
MAPPFAARSLIPNRKSKGTSNRTGVTMSIFRILGTALVVAFGSLPIQSARAAEAAVVTPLMLRELADIPGKEMLMITVDYPPGAVDPVHRHDAHAFLYVLQGSVVMQVRGGKEVTLGPGQTFYEGPDEVHTVGRNASTTEPAKFIVILLKKKGADVLLPAE